MTNYSQDESDRTEEPSHIHISRPGTEQDHATPAMGVESSDSESDSGDADAD